LAYKLAGTVTLIAEALGMEPEAAASSVEVPPKFQNTIEACVGSLFVTKLLPETISVSDAALAATVLGLTEVSVGTGFGVATVMASGLLMPPPPAGGVPAIFGGFTIKTLALPGVSWK